MLANISHRLLHSAAPWNQEFSCFDHTVHWCTSSPISILASWTLISISLHCRSLHGQEPLSTLSQLGQGLPGTLTATHTREPTTMANATVLANIHSTRKGPHMKGTTRRIKGVDMAFWITLTKASIKVPLSLPSSPAHTWKSETRLNQNVLWNSNLLLSEIMLQVHGIKVRGMAKDSTLMQMATFTKGVGRIT